MVEEGLLVLVEAEEALVAVEVTMPSSRINTAVSGMELMEMLARARRLSTILWTSSFCSRYILVFIFPRT